MNIDLSHSLRARLLRFLFAAIILAAIAQAFIAYRTALAEANEIFDYQMQQMALSLRPGLPVGSELANRFITNEDESFDFVVQVWTADGRRVFQSTELAELAEPPQRSALGFSSVDARGTTYRLFSVASGTQLIQVAQDLAARTELAGTLALRTTGPILVMVPFLMLLVWWVVSTSLAPVTRVQKQIAAREVDALTEVSEQGLPDEIRPLVQELNLLFHRMRQAFDAQKNFVADAAHELRSPLAALKLQVEGLRRAHTDAGRELAVHRLSSGIERSSRLVEQLLALARHQASTAAATGNTLVDLTQVARLAMADVATAAQTRQINLGVEQPGECQLSGQAEALRILLRNFLDNAIKYTPIGGQVNLTLRRDGEHIVLHVDDSGPGIPEEDWNRVLDRFYRVTGTEGGGSGLGLAIVKAIADFHGAEISMGHSTRLGGLRATATFRPGK
ncbi:MAG: two-component sensor histidine kinase [Burkholderiales bacterium RIFCSPLOWO2_12_FULL_61_40]|nr:MAG: two-component sensor histidine kinase [Burkholderiales bacterium RIFCSPLOWO2_12_FULL_61_40]